MKFVNCLIFFSSLFMNFSYVYLMVFMQESRFTVFIPYSLFRLFAQAWPIAIVTDVRASFTLSPWLSRSPPYHSGLRIYANGEKADCDRLLPSCRQAPIGIPKKRVGSAQVAYVSRSQSSDRASERASERVRDRMNRTFAKMEKQSLRERAAAVGSFAQCAASKKKTNS